MTSIFAPTRLDGPWTRRLAPRRAWVDALPWEERLADDLGARHSWTQAAFSEYASAVAFAEIAATLAAAAAPLDLIAVAGDFVIDEIVHAEASARLAAALGGGIALEVDLSRLVRPPVGADARFRAIELVVRTCCVGETLTVPLLALARSLSASPLVALAIGRILRDETQHAALGAWILDWADGWLDDDERTRLGRIAGAALRSFAPVLGGGCSGSGYGTLACERYDACFARAALRRVAVPLAARGIVIPADDLAAIGVDA